MDLREDQSRFVYMVARLIFYTHSLGGPGEKYELTFGDAYRDTRCDYGHPDSFHRMRLAIDLNLFIDGEYQTETEAHRPLGEFWESIGGTWGGRWGDGNHYSYKEGL